MISKVVFLIFFFLVSNASLASDVLQYVCKPTTKSNIKHGPEAWALNKEGINKMNMEIFLLYPKVDSSLASEPLMMQQFGDSKKKVIFYLYGSYNETIPSRVEQIGSGRRNLDIHMMGRAIPEAVSAFAKGSQDAALNTFHVISSLGGIQKPDVRKSLRSTKDTYYYGATINSSRQGLDPEILKRVSDALTGVSGLSLFETLFSTPASMILARIPFPFARLEGEPQNFSFKMNLIDQPVAITNLLTQPLYSIEADLNCTRMKGLTNEGLEEVLSYSKTLVPMSNDDKIGILQYTADSDIALPSFDESLENDLSWSNNSFIQIKTEEGFESIKSLDFVTALRIINNSNIDITSEGVLVAGGVILAAAAISRYANPLGAFIAGLGIGPVAAATPCSRFEGIEGLKLFFDLPKDAQFIEASSCPDLAGKLMVISSYIKKDDF